MERSKLWMLVALGLSLVLIGSVQRILAVGDRIGEPPAGPKVVEGVVETIPPGVWDRSVSRGDVAVSAPTAIMSEGFEASWPSAGWVLTDVSAIDGGEYLWGRRDCHPRTGTYGGWSAGGGADGSGIECGGGYVDDMATWAVYGPFDLLTMTQASLELHLWGEVEYEENCAYDFFFIGSSVDGTNFLGTRTCGDWTGGTAGNGYHSYTFSLTNRLGESQVWVGLAFYSDDSITGTGIIVDDIVLTAGEGTLLYLPMITKRFPPIPYTPVLNPIANSGSDGYYTVDWDPADLADTYTLQEDDNASFTSPVVRYSGSSTSWSASGKSPGAYYYRVRASNSWGDGGWSNIQSTTVVPPQTTLYLQNNTGGQLCYEVYGTGIGRKCVSGGHHLYGTFAAGTYTFRAEAWCGTVTQSKSYASGSIDHVFSCVSSRGGTALMGTIE